MTLAASRQQNLSVLQGTLRRTFPLLPHFSPLSRGYPRPPSLVCAPLCCGTPQIGIVFYQ
jgi:hypothetical protein